MIHDHFYRKLRVGDKGESCIHCMKPKDDGKKQAIKKTLNKGMVGELKRTIKDKDLKKDHYQAFKKQHNIK